MTEARTGGPAGIDADHPWPWLDPFTEDASHFFNGRDDDVAALLQMVLAAPVCVLFGRSGLGKTSLLQAGLFPRLAERRLFPVLLRRFDIGTDGAGLSARLLARLDADAAARGLAWQGPADMADDPGGDERVRLWERLHRHDAAFRSADGARWTPLLVLDQFEEVFTLIADSAQRRALFEELGDLLENRVPPGVSARIDADDSLLDRLALDNQPYRCLIALREDFLPELEEWASLLPRLAAHRVRLLPMSRAQALQAVLQTGGSLVDATSAERIVGFLGQQASASRAADARVVEPSLLSLVCASLNEERLAQRRTRLDVEGIDSKGAKILERFYDQAFAALPPDQRDAVGRWVETDLITPSGTRRPFPRRDLSPAVQATLPALVNHRLLRVENAEHGDFIELVHDRLAAVAHQRARARAEQDERDATARAEAAALAHRRRMWRFVAGGTVALVVVLIGTLASVYTLYRQSQQSEAVARKAQDVARAAEKLAYDRATDLEKSIQQLATERANAESAEGRAIAAAAAAASAASAARVSERRALQSEAAAQKEARTATALRLVADGSAMASGNREGGPLRAAWTMLAGLRLAEGLNPAARSRALGAVQQMAQGRIHRIVEGSRALVSAVSADGTLLVAGGRDGTIELFDTTDGASRGQLPMRAGLPIGALALSPDGKELLSATTQGGIMRWDVAERRQLGSFAAGTRIVDTLAFMPGGERVLTIAANPHRATVWDRSTGRRLAETLLSGGEGYMGRSAWAVSRDGRRLALGDRFGSIQIHDAGTLALLGRIENAHPFGVSALAWSANGADLYSASDDGTVSAWDPITAKRHGDDIRTDGSTVRQIAVRPDGAELAVASWDGQLRMISPRSLRPRTDTIKLHAAGLPWQVHYAPDGRSLLSTGGDGAIVALASQRLAVPQRTVARFDGGAIAALAFDPVSITLTVQPRAAPALRLDIGPSQQTLRASTPDRGQQMLSSPDGRAVAQADSRELRIASSSAELANAPTWPLDGVRIVTWLFSPDSRQLLAGLSDGRLLVASAPWTAAPASTRAFQQWSVSALAISPDARELVLGSGSGRLQWRRWPSLVQRDEFEAHEEGITQLAFSPDGRQLASGSNDLQVKFWNTHNRRPLWPAARAHLGGILALTYSRDGRTLASAARDLTTRLWDTSSGELIGAALEPHMSLASIGLAFQPDGRQLATAGDDGQLRLWPVLDAWVDALCAKLPRNPSAEEWREWISSEIPYIAPCPGKPGGPQPLKR